MSRDVRRHVVVFLNQPVYTAGLFMRVVQLGFVICLIDQIDFA